MKYMKKLITKWLFLDDIREPYLDPKYVARLGKKTFNFVSAYHYTFFEPFKTEEWFVVRSHKEFIEYIEKNGAENLFVAFDHDLGDEHYPVTNNIKIIDYDKFKEKTGYDSAKWLCDYCQENGVKFPEYIVHSWNPVGKKNIETYIENYKKHVENE